MKRNIADITVPTEQDILRAILDYLIRIKHIYCWRNNSGAMVKDDHFVRFGKVGSADILGVLPDGKFLAIEVKRPGGKTTPAQDDFLALVRKNGGVAIVAHGVEDVILALDTVVPDWKNWRKKA